MMSHWPKLAGRDRVGHYGFPTGADSAECREILHALWLVEHKGLKTFGCPRMASILLVLSSDLLNVITMKQSRART